MNDRKMSWVGMLVIQGGGREKNNMLAKKEREKNILTRV